MVHNSQQTRPFLRGLVARRFALKIEYYVHDRGLPKKLAIGALVSWIEKWGPKYLDDDEGATMVLSNVAAVHDKWVDLHTYIKGGPMEMVPQTLEGVERGLVPNFEVELEAVRAHS